MTSPQKIYPAENIFPRAVRNLGQIASNKLNALAQNPTRLKTESLILASLALVISRIAIANASAVKARGTPEGPQRYREAIRTDLREIMGWTLGFIVLRQFQQYIGWGIREFLGLRMHDQDDPLLARWGKRALGKEIFRPSLETTATTGVKLDNIFSATVKPNSPDLMPDEYLKWDPAKAHRMDAVERWAGKVTGLFSKTGAAQKIGRNALATGLHEYVPLAIGSLPAVFLAGYVLERVTRDYSDHIVQAVSHSMKKVGDFTRQIGHLHRKIASPVGMPARPAPGLSPLSQPPAFGREMASLTPTLPVYSGYAPVSALAPSLVPMPFPAPVKMPLMRPVNAFGRVSL